MAIIGGDDRLQEATRRELAEQREGRELLNTLIDVRDLLRRGKQAGVPDMVLEIRRELMNRLGQIPRGTLRALRRLRNALDNRPRPDNDRNQFAKVADQLGLDTPMMF